jgi:hypothetical protein
MIQLKLLIEVIQAQITNIDAFFRDGQVFVTWDNLQETNVRYTLYRSPTPIQYGYQLASAQNLGYVLITLLSIQTPVRHNRYNIFKD